MKGERDGRHDCPGRAFAASGSDSPAHSIRVLGARLRAAGLPDYQRMGSRMRRNVVFSHQFPERAAVLLGTGGGFRYVAFGGREAGLDIGFFKLGNSARF